MNEESQRLNEELSQRFQPIVIGTRVHYDGFHGNVAGVVIDLIKYADGSIYEFEVRLDNGRTALAKRSQIRHECAMCAPYGRPGWIFNANQWVRCFDCNPLRSS